MSNSNSAAKVLRTAARRLHKGWTKGTWKRLTGKKGKNGKKTAAEVCIEGAVYGYCEANNRKEVTPAQKTAIRLIQDVIREDYGDKYAYGDDQISIPSFNDDPSTTLDDVLRVVKTAQVRAETGGADEVDEEVDELIPSRRK